VDGYNMRKSGFWKIHFFSPRGRLKTAKKTSQESNYFFMSWYLSSMFYTPLCGFYSTWPQLYQLSLSMMCTALVPEGCTVDAHFTPTLWEIGKAALIE
jgi:hypothetical protein